MIIRFRSQSGATAKSTATFLKALYCKEIYSTDRKRGRSIWQERDVALALFTITSALCGLASNFTMLVFFRFLQGAAGGALAPVGTAMLYRTFPPAERVRISSILIIPTVIAPATGPVLGGLLVDSLSWRWVFFVNVPVGIAAFLFGLFFLQEHREPKAGRFDLPGFL